MHISRFSVLAICLVTTVAVAVGMVWESDLWPLLPVFAALSALGLYDLSQTRHAVRRNYPIIGNFRWLFEALRPELRQYLFESDSEATPFSRSQRSLV